jgi:hypothetical protein
MSDEILMEYFRFQYANCEIYRRYVNLLGVEVQSPDEIPFLPISVFKTHKVYSAQHAEAAIFTSSGTTGVEPARHYVADLDIYRKSYSEAFRLFCGDVSQYAVLALLPSYLERQGSSLITMVQGLIDDSQHPQSGFFLHNHRQLYDTLQNLRDSGTRVLLIGVSFALLDFVEQYRLDFPELAVMETGGMKGRREELTRRELHTALCRGFGVDRILSEYGMTELLSQAYSSGDGLYCSPPWMQIVIRDPRDPFLRLGNGVSGGVNVIDLANLWSCSFIETQDLGTVHPDGSFEIIGRFDESDIRGCNLLISSD